jgi:hypothetical protein
MTTSLCFGFDREAANRWLPLPDGEIGCSGSMLLHRPSVDILRVLLSIPEPLFLFLLTASNACKKEEVHGNAAGSSAFFCIKMAASGWFEL